jgi:hypothetical protein
MTARRARARSAATRRARLAQRAARTQRRRSARAARFTLRPRAEVFAIAQASGRFAQPTLFGIVTTDGSSKMLKR